MQKIKNPWLHKDHYDCFGCCPDNPIGVRMEFFEDGNDIVSFWKPTTHYQGWIDTLHGGVQSTLLDEICGWVVFRKLQTSGVTSKLEVRYHKSIMTTESMITLRAHLVWKRMGMANIEATIYNEKGEVCTEANATYFTFPQDKAKEMGFTTCELEDEQMLF